MDAMFGSHQMHMFVGEAFAGEAFAGEAFAGEAHVLWAALLAQADHLALERQRYADFFEYAPGPYLVTDAQGMVREANGPAVELLAAPRSALLRLSLASFVVLAERAAFRARLIGLGEGPEAPAHRWISTMASRAGEVRRMAVSVRALHTPSTGAATLCWLLHPVT